MNVLAIFGEYPGDF